MGVGGHAPEWCEARAAGISRPHERNPSRRSFRTRWYQCYTGPSLGEHCEAAVAIVVVAVAVAVAVAAAGVEGVVAGIAVAGVRGQKGNMMDGVATGLSGSCSWRWSGRSSGRKGRS